MPNQTAKNLREAFAGESQANRRYLAFARKAEEDGYPHVARLFRAAAESETIHAVNHLQALGGIKSTLENLEEAWKGENEEFSEMYPMFIDQAKRDSNNAAMRSFFWANEAEKKHGEYYDKALKAIREGHDAEFKDLFICSICGYTVEGTAPDICPVCGKEQHFFKQVD